ncbi:MAG: hypothetical protein ACXV3V_02520 [Actinomycetes bacterium]
MEGLPVPSDATREPQYAGGVFCRLGRLFRRWGGLSVPVIEELYGPSRHQARIEVEQQRRLAQPSPAPTDPPQLPEPGTRASGRPRGRFTGVVVVRGTCPTAAADAEPGPDPG